MARRRGRAAPGDPVRLLDERHGAADRRRGAAGGHQIARGHPAAGAVPEHERRARVVVRLDMSPRRPVRGGDLERFHDQDGATDARGGATEPSGFSERPRPTA
jgi:hypothetical protein